MSDSKQVVTSDIEALKDLAKEALEALAKFAEPPHYFVQPGMFIVKKHTTIIERYNLI